MCLKRFELQGTITSTQNQENKIGRKILFLKRFEGLKLKTWLKSRYSKSMGKCIFRFQKAIPNNEHIGE